MARQPILPQKPDLADVVQQHEQGVSMRRNLLTLLALGFGLVVSASLGAFIAAHTQTDPSMIPLGSIGAVAAFALLAIPVSSYVLPRLDAREQRVLVQKIDEHIEHNTNRAEKRRLDRELRRTRTAKSNRAKAKRPRR